MRGLSSASGSSRCVAPSSISTGGWDRDARTGDMLAPVLMARAFVVTLAYVVVGLSLIV